MTVKLTVVYGTPDAPDVFDKHYLNQASPDAASARLRFAAPATFGATVSFNFQPRHGETSTKSLTRKTTK